MSRLKKRMITMVLTRLQAELLVNTLEFEIDMISDREREQPDHKECSSFQGYKKSVQKMLDHLKAELT